MFLSDSMKSKIIILGIIFLLVMSLSISANARVPGTNKQADTICKAENEIPCSDSILRGATTTFIDSLGKSHTIDCQTEYGSGTLFQSGNAECLRYHTKGGWFSSESNRVYPVKYGYKINKKCFAGTSIGVGCKITSSDQYFILQSDYCKGQNIKCSKASGKCQNAALFGQPEDYCPRLVNGEEDYSGCKDGNTFPGDNIIQAGQQ